MTDSGKKPGIDAHKQSLLRKLPGVDHLLEIAKADTTLSDTPKTVLTKAVRQVVDECRKGILDGGTITEESLIDNVLLFEVKAKIKTAMHLNLTPLINATGIVVHTNLGRSLLARQALDHVLCVSERYSNLEYNLASGSRGIRYSNVEGLLCEITGAEAAMVVNNNAAAVLLCLDSIAAGREVIVSRGELVEIGGSFRIPDVMAKSGAILKEVGTTNRTHLHDYERALTDATGLLMKVHTSNFGIVGFTVSVSLKDLVVLGAQHQLPVMEDLGSGTFIDFSKYGLTKEPTVQESVRAGADIVTFSGDKLLGGPQAGIILGKPSIISKIRQNPLTRALRIDKLTLAALESTLRLYRDEDTAVDAIPTLNMLTCSIKAIAKKAETLKNMIDAIGNPRLQADLLDTASMAGGGSLPLMPLPSRSLGIQIETMTADAIEKKMRKNDPPIIGRIEKDQFLMDMRTVQTDELPKIAHALLTCIKGVDDAATY
jgi:L-seryl-tRNA(Ser) seleniumtransferase